MKTGNPSFLIVQIFSMLLEEGLRFRRLVYILVKCLASECMNIRHMVICVEWDNDLVSLAV